MSVHLVNKISRVPLNRRSASNGLDCAPLEKKTTPSPSFWKPPKYPPLLQPITNPFMAGLLEAVCPFRGRNHKGISQLQCRYKSLPY